MANLKEAVQWIAYNDNAGQEDTVEDISQYLTVVLVADLFKKDAEQVARKVMYWRKQYFKSLEAK